MSVAVICRGRAVTHSPGDHGDRRPHATQVHVAVNVGLVQARQDDLFKHLPKFLLFLFQ